MASETCVEIKVELNGGALPLRATAGAAGFDLCAAENVSIEPGHWCLIHTGLRLAIPVGYEAQVRPRSGLALKHGVTVLNAPGTIDSDYRGEVGVVLINHGHEPVAITRGDRIAQLVFAKVPDVRLVEVPAGSLGETARGAGGFGSTGAC